MYTINFGLFSQRSTCAGHLQCHNGYCDYMHHNKSVHNNIEWVGSTPLPYVMGNVASDKSTLESKVCRLTHVCLALCHACIIYVHSTSIGMFKACIHMSVHDHPMFNGACQESLDIAYECVTNGVLKTPTSKKTQS